MIRRMSSLILATLGPFHILHPRYNAVTLLELAQAHSPTKILLASYGPQELAEGRWREAGELSFFHLLPWAQTRGVAVEALDTLEHLKAEGEVFREALAQYPRGRELLEQAAGLEATLQAVLTQPRTPADWAMPQTLQPLREYLEGLARTFGEGPATGHRRRRMEQVATRLQGLPEGRYVVLADALDYALLLELLPNALTAKEHQPGEAERQRSVLDKAWRLEEADDWALLLEQLREVGGPEATYCAAQVYLAAGQLEDAFALLEQLVHSDFQHPAYLPGYTLARYGQLADALGQREKALRAYQAILALSWAPQEAREIALAGQRTPFRLG
jgi:tetratricopeptide (TPR) repeat protein